MEVVPGELSGHVGDLTVLTLTQPFIRRVTARKFKRERRWGRVRQRKGRIHKPSAPAPFTTSHNALFVFHPLLGLAPVRSWLSWILSPASRLRSSHIYERCPIWYHICHLDLNKYFFLIRVTYYTHTLPANWKCVNLTLTLLSLRNARSYLPCLFQLIIRHTCMMYWASDAYKFLLIN